MFSVKEPVPFDLRCALSTSFCVQVVMPVTSARLADISRRALVSI